jgi:hypothetical protein
MLPDKLEAAEYHLRYLFVQNFSVVCDLDLECRNLFTLETCISNNAIDPWCGLAIPIQVRPPDRVKEIRIDS